MRNSPSGNVQYMQKINRLKLLSYIRSHEPVSRTELAQKNGLSLSSVTNIINYLQANDLVYETGTEFALRVCRKATLLEFNKDSYEFICVYIDNSNIFVSRTNLAGQIIDMCDISCPCNDLLDILTTVTNTGNKCVPS